MLAKKFSTRDSRRGLIATAAAVVCIVGGVGLIGVSIASQRRAPGAVKASESWLLPTIPATRPSENASPNVIGPILPRSKPVALDIPSIGVHSVVQYLGQTADGALEVPAPGPHYNEAAWYRYSPTPGSLGPAVVLGHVDSAADGPSVFFRLGELRPGDRVSITRADDSVAVFIVDEVHRYAKDNFPTELVYGDINHAGLRILTCGGAFDDSTGHYLDNIVVFASLVDRDGVGRF
ncbi:MAG: class F sortase [Actinobacteria bacterium]|nr:class F sortase [Actinomycetota bacterium]